MAEKKKGKKDGSNRLVPTLSMGAQNFTISSDNTSEAFSVKFSVEEQILAAGYGDGSIKVFNTISGKHISTLSVIGKSQNLPIPTLKFRPNANAERTRNVIVAGYSEGFIRHWHATSGKCLQTIAEEGNQIYCLDYRADGEKFASAGKDFKVRIYDENSKTLDSVLTGGFDESIAGHSNRVYTLKYHPLDNNLILTAGWDNTIQFWDSRIKHSIRSIHGPHVCGESIDIDLNEILVGSWRTTECLQIYDFTTGKLMREIEWKQLPTDGTTLIYSSKFSPRNADLIVAGGSGSNEAKLFDRKSGTVIGRTPILPGSVYSIDFDPEGKRIVVAGALNSLHMYDITMPQTALHEAKQNESDESLPLKEA